jgi:hypothetical protein
MGRPSHRFVKKRNNPGAQQKHLLDELASHTPSKPAAASSSFLQVD